MMFFKKILVSSLIFFMITIDVSDYAHAKEIYTDYSYLYHACKGENKIYCKEALYAMASGYGLATMAYPANKEVKCVQKQQDVIDRIQWLGLVMRKNSWEDIAKKLVADIDSVQDKVNIDYVEIFKASLFDAYQKSQTAPIKTPVEKWPKTHKTTRDLYLSCQKIDKLSTEKFQRTFCHSTIVGIRLGYDLAAYNLPEYSSDHNCSTEKHEIVNLLQKRLFDFDYRCHFSFPDSASNIARSYVENIKNKLPENIMSIAQEPLFFEMIRATQRICKIR